MNRTELYENIKRKGSFLCIGLDSDKSMLPAHLAGRKNPIFEFNKTIIDATSHLAVAYKPNLAFYEAEGATGWEQLAMSVEYIREKDPSIFIIADAKRGDIDNTAQKYAEAFFKTMDFDAVTLSPYMGYDSIAPFLEYRGKWAIILALTSNASAIDFEMPLMRDTMEPLYKGVINRSMRWGSEDNTMFVIGATRPEKLLEIREYCPDHFFLVPGVGAQGGSLKSVANYGMNDRCGLLVNVSRSIIFAGSGEDFAQKAEAEASAMQTEMAQMLIRL